MYDPFVFIEEDNGPHRLWYEIAEERPANPDTMMGQFYSGSGHPQYMLFMWDEARLREMGYLSGDDSPWEQKDRSCILRLEITWELGITSRSFLLA